MRCTVGDLIDGLSQFPRDLKLLIHLESEDGTGLVSDTSGLELIENGKCELGIIADTATTKRVP